MTAPSQVARELTAIESSLAADVRRLTKERDELRDALERIANSVAIGAESKQLHARMRAIFKGIEDEARKALGPHAAIKPKVTK